jgi:hypothetical protein
LHDAAGAGAAMCCMLLQFLPFRHAASPHVPFALWL